MQSASAVFCATLRHHAVTSPNVFFHTVYCFQDLCLLVLSDPQFTGSPTWSTMHFYFHDHTASDLVCTKAPDIKACWTGISCCPS